MQCRLCNNATYPLFTQRVMNRYDAQYFRCGVCDLIQSEDPYWLPEAYGGGAMADADTGAIARNSLCAQTTSVLTRLLKISPDAPCIDFGGGHGVFVRMMRDRGMDFRLCDKYAENLFARGFETGLDQTSALLTTFEVFEHLANPAADIQRMFAGQHDFILVGTVLHRGHRPGWWYYWPQTGQHVALYSALTMQTIGARFGYEPIGGPAYTLFIRSDQRLDRWRRKVITRLLKFTRPNANARLTRILDKLLPAYPSRVVGDSGRLPQKQAA